MKQFKTLVALVLVAMMSLALVGSALATTVETAKITIKDANPGQTYTFYRVFDAVISSAGVSYKVISGKTLPDNAYFVEDAQGNVSATADAKTSGGELTAGAIAWLKTNAATVGEQETTASLTAGATAQADLEVTGLTPGYYYITTTTGTAISAHTSSGTTITDKNPPTTIDKTITNTEGGYIDSDGTNAFAQIGKTVKFEARIPIANGAKNYRFEDDMSAGLTLTTSSVKVYIVNKNAAVATDADDIASSTYGTLTTDDTSLDIIIAFAQSFLDNNIGKDIVVKYEAVINSSAVITDAGNPNTAHIYWGNKDNYLHEEDTVKVYTAKIGVFKTQNDSTTPLEGAGFKLKNSEGKYYKLVSGVVTWVTEQAADAAAGTPAVTGDEHFSDSTGAVPPFIGLQNGVYTLEESTVPAGFNKAADVDVTIADDDFGASNISHTQPVVNNAGAVMPSTGGIGTTIFYVAGIVLVLGAAAIIIARRKAEQE